MRYVVGISGNVAYNKIVISSKLGSFEFGNKGCTGPITKTISYSQTIFKFSPPPFPLITIGDYVKGSMFAGFGVLSGSGTNAKYWARVAGDLILGAEVKLGWDVITSLSAYAEGTIISALAQTTISQGVVAKHPIFKLSIGQLIVGIRGCILYVFRPNLWSAVIFKGWTLN